MEFVRKMKMQKVSLEFWADSFHEGSWACQELGHFFEIKQSFMKKVLSQYFCLK